MSVLSKNDKVPEKMLEHEKIEWQWGEALMAPEVDMPLVLDLMSKIINHCDAHQLDIGKHQVKFYEDRPVGEHLFFHIFKLARFGFRHYTVPTAIMEYWDRARDNRRKKEKELERPLPIQSSVQFDATKTSVLADGGEGLGETQVDQLLAVLFEKGFKIDRADPNEGLWWLEQLQKSPQLFKRILSEGLNPRLKLIGGEEILLSAASIASPEIAKLLIDAGASVASKGRNGMTALMLAASRHTAGAAEMVKLLMEEGARLNVQNDTGFTALHFAAGRGNRACISVLVKHRARVDLLDNKGRTPLHHVAIYGASNIQERGAIIAELISAGAYINAKDAQGHTPLHLAASQGNFEMVKLLIEHGARADVKNKKAKSSLDIARQKGHQEIAIFLEQMELTQKEHYELSKIGQPIGLIKMKKYHGRDTDGVLASNQQQTVQPLRKKNL